MSRAALAVAGLLAGCVNDYQVVGAEGSTSEGGSSTTCDTECRVPDPTSSTTLGDSNDASSTSTTDAPTTGPTTSTDSTSSSTSSESGSETMPDPMTSSSSSGGPTGLELCQACTADSQCGDEFDFCDGLSGGMVACLRACEEKPACPKGYSCMTITSVDGAMGDQCVPDGNTCGE